MITNLTALLFCKYVNKKVSALNYRGADYVFIPKTIHPRWDELKLIRLTISHEEL